MDKRGSRSRSRSRSRERGAKKTEFRHQSKRSETSAAVSNTNREVWGNIAKEEEDEAAKRAAEIPEEEKVKANFGLSGALAKDENTGNMLNGVLLKWTEPLDASIPTKRWRFYVFKESEVVDTLHVHRQSAYLFGKDTRVADIAIAHPSCSKQHAVLQFRRVDKKDETGKVVKVVKPYIMDLASSNKTFLNGKEIEDSRYYELLEKDCLKFGFSTREYVLLHEDSA